MKRFYFLLFTFFQMCTAKAMGLPDPGPNDLWMQLLIRDKIEEIMDKEDLFDTITYENSNNLILKKTLLLGAPNSNTIGRNLIVDEKVPSISQEKRPEGFIMLHPLEFET